MCSGCRMDPAWVQEMYARQGAVDVDDFYKEVNYQTRMKGRGRKRDKKTPQPKTRPGCPGNDFGKHVYVWTTEREHDSLFYRFYGFYEYQHNVCVGCGKQNGSKRSDEYVKRNEREYYKKYPSTEFTIKRGAPVGRNEIRRNYRPKLRWFRFESYDEKFVAYKKDYINRHGWNSVVYGF